MPDFNKLKPKTCAKREVSQLTKPQAPQFTSDARGEEKRARLMEQVEAQRRAALEATNFKAREFKPSDVRAASVGGGSSKTTPSAALMAVVKDFQLHSLLRVQKREEFDKKQREREEEQQRFERLKLEQLKRQEEEEIERIRKQMMFKA